MKKASAFKNYIYTALYQLTAILVPLILTPYLARTLLPAGIGQYGYTYSLLSLFRIVAVLGFNIYGQREIAKCRDDIDRKSKVFWEIMIAKSIPCTLSFFVYCMIAWKGVAPTYSILLWCFLPNFVTYFFDVTFLLQGDEAFRTITIRDFIAKALGIIAVFVFVKGPGDVWIYALSYGLVSFATISSLLFYCRKRIKRVPLKELHPLHHIRYSIILFIPAIATSMFTVIDKGMIQWITGSDEEVGYYEESQKIITLLFGLIASVGTVMVPHNANVVANRDYEHLKRNVNKSISYSFLLAIPLCLGIVSVSNIFIPIFLGDGYESAIPILMIMAPMMILMTVTNVVGIQYLVPIGKEWKYTVAVVIAAAVNALANLLFIRFFSAAGAAMGSILSEAVCAGILLYFGRDILSFEEIYREGWKSLVSGLVMFIAVFGTARLISPSILHLFLLVFEGAAIFFVMNLALQNHDLTDLTKKVWSILRRKQ